MRLACVNLHFVCSVIVHFLKSVVLFVSISVCDFIEVKFAELLTWKYFSFRSFFNCDTNVCYFAGGEEFCLRGAKCFFEKVIDIYIFIILFFQCVLIAD